MRRRKASQGYPRVVLTLAFLIGAAVTEVAPAHGDCTAYAGLPYDDGVNYVEGYAGFVCSNTHDYTIVGGSIQIRNSDGTWTTVANKQKLTYTSKNAYTFPYYNYPGACIPGRWFRTIVDGQAEQSGGSGRHSDGPVNSGASLISTCSGGSGGGTGGDCAYGVISRGLDLMNGSMALRPVC